MSRQLKSVEQSVHPTVRDRADDAYHSLAAKGTVLARLYELRSLCEDAKDRDINIGCDFGGEREYHFWDGLRVLTGEMLAAADVMREALEDGKGGAR